MTRPRARESLVVIWEGELHPGIIAYGLTTPGGWKRGEFPLHLWPAGTRVNNMPLHGEQWEVMRWDIALAEWPLGAAWTRTVRETLSYIVAGACVVSWLGCEGCPFADPPDLLSPEWMSGGVLAAMTAAGEFYCAVDPDAPLGHLGDDVLLHLRDAARGLADAPE